MPQILWFRAMSYNKCWWVITQQKLCESAMVFDDRDISSIYAQVPFHTDIWFQDDSLILIQTVLGNICTMYVLQMLDTSLGNLLQVRCTLSRGHISVLRTCNTSYIMSNYFLHFEKRQHNTKYCRHAQKIWQHQLNMSLHLFDTYRILSRIQYVWT